MTDSELLRLHLQDKLQTVGATLGKLEMEIARHPETPGLVANIRSLRKLHGNLQAELASESDKLATQVQKEK